MKLQLYYVPMFGRSAESCSVACCVINQTALNYASWMSWQRPDVAWSVFSILPGAFIATNNGKLTRSGRSDSGGLTTVGDGIDSSDRNQSSGVGKLLMCLTHLLALRRCTSIPALKLIALPAEMNTFLWSLEILCEKWHNFSPSLFREEAFSTARCLFGSLCILTISHYAIMHARHDKHPFEKLPVTVAKLISVIIAVSITCCYLKKQFRVCSLLWWQRVASIANKYCGAGC